MRKLISIILAASGIAGAEARAESVVITGSVPLTEMWGDVGDLAPAHGSPAAFTLTLNDVWYANTSDGDWTGKLIYAASFDLTFSGEHAQLLNEVIAAQLTAGLTDEQGALARYMRDADGHVDIEVDLAPSDPEEGVQFLVYAGDPAGEPTAPPAGAEVTVTDYINADTATASIFDTRGNEWSSLWGGGGALSLRVLAGDSGCGDCASPSEAASGCAAASNALAGLAVALLLIRRRSVAVHAAPRVVKSAQHE